MSSMSLVQQLQGLPAEQLQAILQQLNKGSAASSSVHTQNENHSGGKSAGTTMPVDLDVSHHVGTDAGHGATSAATFQTQGEESREEMGVVDNPFEGEQVDAHICGSEDKCHDKKHHLDPNDGIEKNMCKVVKKGRQTGLKDYTFADKLAAIEYAEEMQFITARMHNVVANQDVLASGRKFSVHSIAGFPELHVDTIIGWWRQARKEQWKLMIDDSELSKRLGPM